MTTEQADANMETARQNLLAAEAPLKHSYHKDSPEDYYRKKSAATMALAHFELAMADCLTARRLASDAES
jgi:hypothetical protein